MYQIVTDLYYQMSLLLYIGPLTSFPLSVPQFRLKSNGNRTFGAVFHLRIHQLHQSWFLNADKLLIFIHCLLHSECQCCMSLYWILMLDYMCSECSICYYKLYGKILCIVSIYWVVQHFGKHLCVLQYKYNDLTYIIIILTLVGIGFYSKQCVVFSIYTVNLNPFI